jgi:nicotinamidase-related amidase
MTVFEGTDLDRILRANAVGHLFVSGQCIEHVVATTIKRAPSRHQIVLSSLKTREHTGAVYVFVTWLIEATGSLVAPSFYVMFGAAVGIAALFSW